MTCRSEMRDPVAATVTPDERAELLVQLKARRRRLLDAFAVEACTADTGPAVSSLWPVAMVQLAIAAIEADFAESGP